MTIFSLFPLTTVTSISFMLLPNSAFSWIETPQPPPQHPRKWIYLTGSPWQNPGILTYLRLSLVFSHHNLGFLEVVPSYWVPFSLPCFRQWRIQKSSKRRLGGCYLFAFSCVCSCIPPSAMESLTLPGSIAEGSFPSSWASAGAKLSVFRVKTALKSNPKKTEYVSLFCPAQWLFHPFEFSSK